MTINVELDLEALPDVAQLIRNGIEQERRRPKFGGGALNAARRIARLQRALEVVERSQRLAAHG